MTDATKIPWHLWVIGVIALVWSAGGAFDYLMTQTRNEAYMSQFTPEQVEYFHGFPPWIVAAWAIGVWGGVLGALLLLMRRDWAVPVFWLSFLSTLAAAIYTYMIAAKSFSEFAGTYGTIFSLLIIVFAGFLIWYAQRMRTTGVLQ